MISIKVDEDKCKKDGICAAVCPGKVIALKDGHGYPLIKPGRESACIRCGHCVAACPHGALSHSQIPIENCPAINTDLVINAEQAAQFLRSRRSTREFRDKPVGREKIQQLIEMARYAPTAGNTQKVEWLVLTDKNKLHEISGMAVELLRRKIVENPQILIGAPYLKAIVKAWDMGLDPITWNAPVLVVASAPGSLPNGMVDLCGALSYFDLFAPTMGLGTCWAGLLQQAIISSSTIKEFVGVPVDHSHHFPMLLGYPKVRYYRLPTRKPPKITFG